MKKAGLTLTGMATLLVIGSLWWRRESKRRNLPTPFWLGWLFDNQVFERVAGTEANLDRIGVQPGERVLDVGSGPGRLAIPAARRVGSQGSVVALDLQQGMLDRLESRVQLTDLKNIELRLGDITKQGSLTDGEFDRAYLVTVMGEIPASQEALQILYQALKPGGVLSITEMLPDPHYQRRDVVLSQAWEAGFEPSEYWGWVGGYTQNFTKPSR
jgi:SAM-dependent methyltransferase